jgi:hypothetical protein
VRRRHVIAGALLVCACAGCGSGGGKHGAPTTPTNPKARATVPAACTVLTEHDASTFLHSPVRREPSAGDTAGSKSCSYSSTSRPTLLVGRVSNDIRSFGGLATALTADPIAGVGEEAYLLRDVSDPTTVALEFRRHGLVVALLYTNVNAGGGTSQRTKDLERLATTIASRL